tara:strand:- start:185 stop:1459 length:1275 start_codon:yes stop_codon:yes gene_type:complete
MGDENKSIIFGRKLFNLGFIFLPSALPIGVFFLLLSVTISLSKVKRNLLKDKWNYYLLIASGLMIFGCLKTYLIPPLNEPTLWKPNYLWLDLFNWIPLFICFYSFQIYLKTHKDRLLFIKSLIIGSFPIFITCIGHYWFGWSGPLKTLNGTIIWYLKLNSGLLKYSSGLFSNPNYAAFWLATLFPLSMSLIYLNKKFKKLISIIISSIIFYLGILTNSRNGLLCLIIGFTFFFKLKILVITFLIVILIVGYFQYFVPIEVVNSNEIIQKLIPKKLIFKLSQFKLDNILIIPRIEIWYKTLSFIRLKPIFGWGASTFSTIYFLNGGDFKAQHTHNILFQITYDYGILLALILFLFTINLLIKSWQRINKETINFQDKGLFAATVVALIFHMTDIPYYDGRISILIWALLASVKCIIENDEEFIEN